MPRQEVSSVVDGQSLLDMSDNKVIKSGFGASGNGGRRKSRLRLQALDGIDVSLTAAGGKRAPSPSQCFSLPRKKMEREIPFTTNSKLAQGTSTIITLLSITAGLIFGLISSLFSKLSNLIHRSLDISIVTVITLQKRGNFGDILRRSRYSAKNGGGLQGQNKEGASIHDGET
jgi:hypothetical protein